MSKAKQKGTKAETEVVKYLVDSGVFPDAHRSALLGINDVGDIVGVGDLTIQVKNCKTPKITIWLRDTEEQRIRGRRTYGVVVAKRDGYGDTRVGNWYAIMLSEQWKQLWNEAGKPDVSFYRAGRQPGPALAMLTSTEHQVITAGLRLGTEISDNTHYKIMNFAGFINLLRLRKEINRESR